MKQEILRKVSELIFPVSLSTIKSLREYLTFRINQK